MKESKFVKTKIVAGYLLLIAVCILSVGYVYRVAVRFSAPDSSYALLHTKRSAVNRTLYHLYQAESYGQLMIAGYASYEARYRRELRTVRASIDSLRALTAGGDSLQTMRLDSITRLIADKERRTVSLRRSIRAGATAGLLDKNIRSLIGPREAVMADTIPFRSIVRQDTTAVPRAKRRFFQRLGDLFSPPEADSSLVISRRETIAPVIPVDAVKDTIVLVLQALQDSVTSNRQGIYDHAWQEGLRLSYSNELVNTKIYRLIMDFEAEDTAYLMQRIERNEAFRRRSSRILGGVAIGAVVLMLLFVGMLWRDINRSNRYRRELERANRDKESLLEAREKLMLAITHDIKAPLGSVMGYIDLLARLTGDKRQELYLRNMKESSEHLLALVDSLLDFYRLDINKIEVTCVAFSPAQLFETIRAGFAAAAAAKGLELCLEAEPAAAGEVSGDAFHIRQIADNLISNALKFTDEGSVTLRVDVVRGRLVFSVRDTGRGIGREEKERIFAEFVRLSSAQGVGGFGLGLSIVDRLVKLLDGTISLESRLGEGSRFIVSVPVGEAAGSAPAEAGEPVPQAGLRVLLVDDDPLQLEMTAAMCRRAGVGCESCQYPEYVAKLVGESRFDLVLTDIQMPSADGFGVLEAVRGVDPGLKVVAVSARGDLDAADFTSRGFAGCLRKPFTYSELVAAIRAACGSGETVPQGGDPEIPLADGIDFTALTAYAGDDPEAARNILHSFAEQTAGNCTGLERALGEGDAAAVKALAHKMLPIFTMLGAAEVAEALRRAETCEGPLPETLCGELRAAVEKIRAIVAEAEKTVSL
ncbi:MAG: response regulator [Alistipes sp.]|uniref:sensor histidine kinase n=1 Tax=Alistipes sp. TaxID=1872444 RepID=UPI001D63C709|nr:ATP-binding protein [Alistipes sp.]MBS5019183.1 response regulator [Alistipes sp.]